jgi:hypothetical protein
MPAAEKISLRRGHIFLAGEAMKKTRFIFIGCLLAAAAISLLALMKVSPQQESQDSAMQTSSPHRATHNGNITGNAGGYSNSTSGIRNKRVSDNPNRHGINTNGGGTGKINSTPSKNLSMSGAGGNLKTGLNGRSTATAKTTDKTKSDNADGLYASNRGQNGEPEAILASKSQNNLKYYKDRTATAEVIEETESQADGSQVQLITNTQQGSAVITDNTENTIDSLAQQNLDENVDHELQVQQLLAALAESNPPEVRLQAIYLLEDTEPGQVKNFLDDKNDLIRTEAERFVGILPQDYN